jgi:RNA ligase (TIGR02306 family)
MRAIVSLFLLLSPLFYSTYAYNGNSLCFSGRIEQLKPIKGADFVHLATAYCGPKGGSWRGIVKIADFPEVGLPCTVFLMDAVMPNIPQLEFMKVRNFIVNMSRVKGVPSECVIVKPLTEDLEPGVDLTTILKVTKYEKSVSPNVAGLKKGTFPRFIPRTDEPNCQRLLETNFNAEFAVTLKYDGTSTTAYRVNDHFGVCSRNLELNEGKDLYWTVANQYKLRLPNNIAIQWETCGPNIGSNAHSFSKLEGFLFAAYQIAERRYLTVDETEELASKLGFPMAKRFPNMFIDTLDIDKLQEEVRQKAVHEKSGKPLEGLVYRALKNDVMTGQKFSFKVINLDYKH